MPAGGASSPPLPGGSGIMPAGTTTGVRGATLDGDRCGAAVMAVSAKSPEAWPELSPGTMTPWDESRGGTPAGERARKRKGGASRLIRGAPRAPFVCGRYCPASAGVPLPYFFRGLVGWAEFREAHAVKARRKAQRGHGAFRAFAHPTKWRS